MPVSGGDPAEHGADDHRGEPARHAPTAAARRRIQLIRMIASEMKASHGTCQRRNAGRIEMNAIEMPASAPSIAARGVYLRMVGPTKAPSRMMSR